MRAALSPTVWLVDMIDEVARKVRQDGLTHIGLLSSGMSRQLYVRAAANHQLQITLLDEAEQEQIDEIINRILSGERTPRLKAELQGLADAQIARGAPCVVLGCTDLPLILGQADVQYPLYTSNDILAEALFNFAIRA